MPTGANSRNPLFEFSSFYTLTSSRPRCTALRRRPSLTESRHGFCKCPRARAEVAAGMCVHPTLSVASCVRLGMAASANHLAGGAFFLCQNRYGPYYDRGRPANEGPEQGPADRRRPAPVSGAVRSSAGGERADSLFVHPNCAIDARSTTFKRSSTTSPSPSRRSKWKRVRLSSPSSSSSPSSFFCVRASLFPIADDGLLSSTRVGAIFLGPDGQVLQMPSDETARKRYVRQEVHKLSSVTVCAPCEVAHRSPYRR